VAVLAWLTGGSDRLTVTRWAGLAGVALGARTCRTCLLTKATVSAVQRTCDGCWVGVAGHGRLGEPAVDLAGSVVPLAGRLVATRMGGSCAGC
jgi:hypothetical protein